MKKIRAYAVELIINIEGGNCFFFQIKFYQSYWVALTNSKFKIVDTLFQTRYFRSDPNQLSWEIKPLVNLGLRDIHYSVH